MVSSSICFRFRIVVTGFSSLRMKHFKLKVLTFSNALIIHTEEKLVLHSLFRQMPRYNRCNDSSPPKASPIQLILCKVKQTPVHGKRTTSLPKRHLNSSPSRREAKVLLQGPNKHGLRRYDRTGARGAH